MYAQVYSVNTVSAACEPYKGSSRHYQAVAIIRNKVKGRIACRCLLHCR